MAVLQPGQRIHTPGGTPRLLLCVVESAIAIVGEN